MTNKYRTPMTRAANVITFTCSDSSIEPLVELLERLKYLGNIGCTRTIPIDWDGDGNNRLANISVNGMTLDEWEIEWKRLNKLRK